jgi:uncharacterized protein DUF4157
MGDFGHTGKAGGVGGGVTTSAGGAHASPGKRTLTEDLQRKAAPGAPADVSGEARAEVTSAFGSRAHGVDYSVGAGAAEARGANAITIAGKVDFAPGQYDAGSPDGRARLGEETAHAMQQSNPGEPSSVASLEGEAKRAGNEFAAGRAPKVELAAPPTLALADNPTDKDAVKPDTAPKDTDPSTEVPDLRNGELAAIKKVITSDPDEALKQLLKALQRIDAKQFAVDDLTGKQLGTKGGSSVTKQGPVFETWLDSYLGGVAAAKSKTKDKLTKAEVKQAIHEAVPPADKKDISCRISTGAFASASLLYSTVRHELVHVGQIRASYLEYLPSSLMPQGVSSPSDSKVGEDREVEAYLWEMEHLASTGLTDLGEVFLLWEQCSTAWLNSGPGSNKLKARFEAAFKTVWGKSMDGHLAAIDTAYQAFKKTSSVASASNVQTLESNLDKLWRYRNNFGINWNPYVARETAAETQLKEMNASIKADAFKKTLDSVDAKIKAGYADDQGALTALKDLTGQWDALEQATRDAVKDRFKATAPVLWEKTLALMEAEIRRRIGVKEFDIVQEYIDGDLKDLFGLGAKSQVTIATFEPRRAALKTELAKARAAKSAP